MDDEPLRKLWLVFFGNSHRSSWWHRFLRPGFRHVSAAAFYPVANRWVYYDPTSRGTVIELWHPDDFWQRFGQLIRDSTVILRIPSAYERRLAPFSWWCVGAISSLLGYRLGAMTPFSLHRCLLENGAELVERPSCPMEGEEQGQREGSLREMGKNEPGESAREAPGMEAQKPGQG
jgi:hypothetical protein